MSPDTPHFVGGAPPPYPNTDGTTRLRMMTHGERSKDMLGLK